MSECAPQLHSRGKQKVKKKKLNLGHHCFILSTPLQLFLHASTLQWIRYPSKDRTGETQRLFSFQWMAVTIREVQ